MASAIPSDSSQPLPSHSPKNPTKFIYKNTHQRFPSKNSKFPIFSDLKQLRSEQKFREAVSALDFMAKQGISPDITVYETLLQSCASEKDLALANEVYVQLIRSGLPRDVYLETRTVGMFVKCGSLVDALRVFEGIEGKNLHCWSVILNGFCGNGCFDETLRLFAEMCKTHLRADGFVLTSVLKACGRVGNSILGREIHGYVYRYGYESDVFVNNCLIYMYGKCGLIGDARQVFDKIPHRDAVSWNSMLKCYSQQDQFDEFIELFDRMRNEGVDPNLITWNTVISGYACYGFAKEALDCFAKMQSMGLKPDIISCNSLIAALGINGHFAEALELIRQMQIVGLKPDSVSWTTLVGGYTSFGQFEDALNLFSKLHRSGEIVDEFIFPTVLKACAGLEDLKQGKEIHTQIIRGGFEIGSFVNASLVDMYAKCGRLDYASKLLCKNNIASWNSLISGYIRNGCAREAKHLFQQLQSECVEPDLISWNILIDCDAREGNIMGGLDALSQMELAGISPDLISWNSLINGYSKITQINDALYIINQIRLLGLGQNASSWNALICNFVDQGAGKEALQVFHLMKNSGIKPDPVTITGVLRACALLEALRFGKSVHGWIIRSNTSDKYINCTLLDMYIKSNDMGSAWKLFDRTLKRNLVLWNEMISGFARKGKVKEAHKLLHELELDKLKPDVISWTSVIVGFIKSGNADVALEIWTDMWESGIRPDPIAMAAGLTACANLGTLKSGKVVHSFSITTGLEKDPCVQASLIAMYSKCGSIQEAISTFERAPHNRTVIWNSMISGYALHGHGKQALSLFQRMQTEGVDLDSVTFICVLSACFQEGLCSEGLQVLDAMLLDFEILYGCEKYAHAINLARNICSKLDLETFETCALVLKTYTGVNEVGETTNLGMGAERSTMIRRQRSSWIHINGKWHRFDEGDNSQSQMDVVYKLLWVLNRQVNQLSDD